MLAGARQEQRVGDPLRMVVAVGVQERHRTVGHLQGPPDTEVIADPIAEIVLQIGAVGALRLGVDLDTCRCLGESRDDAEAVFAHLGHRFHRIGLWAAGNLARAPDPPGQQGE